MGAGDVAGPSMPPQPSTPPMPPSDSGRTVSSVPPVAPEGSAAPDRVVELDVGNVAAYLVGQGLVAADEEVRAESLGGGISNVVLRVRSAAGCLVLKQSLPELRVAVTWEFDRSRILVERDCMLALAELLPPGHAPVVRFSDPANFVLVMSCAPPGRVWKDALLAGHVDVQAARRVGVLLGRLQARAAADPGRRACFDDLRVLHQGRIDPYHRTVTRAHPDLAPTIDRDVERLVSNRRTLVLGDLSPKNVLVYPDRVLLLDFEVAHWGDPAFDPAFLLTHLVLKAVHVRSRTESLLAAAEAFWSAYRACVPDDWSPELEHGVGLELGCLLLARVDGKSPAEYLTEAERALVRRLGRHLLTRPSPGPRPALARIAAHLHRTGADGAGATETSGRAGS